MAYQKNGIIAVCMLILFTGCSLEQPEPEPDPRTDFSMANKTDAVESPEFNEDESMFNNTDKNHELSPAKIILPEDWSDYFQGINGCAVIYNSATTEYSVYNPELAEKRSSPCSTFKIISALIGLENHVLESENSRMAWNGTAYPVDVWNQDLTLKQAFQSSCVWYFRNVIDQTGQERVTQALSELKYGNCDTSEWEGSGANSGYAELNGFWLGSSLLVSPMEQVDTLFRIFSDSSLFRETSLSVLYNIMETETSGERFRIYGKTGTGYRQNRCVDAWFVGFVAFENRTCFFAVRLDDPDNSTVSDNTAKEIALRIIGDLPS